MNLTVVREQAIIAELKGNELQVRSGLKAALRNGELLSEVKASGVPFLEWIAQNAPFSQQMASRYVRAWEGSKLQLSGSLEDYTISELAALAPSQRATPPASVVHRIADKVPPPPPPLIQAGESRQARLWRYFEDEVAMLKPLMLRNLLNKPIEERAKQVVEHKLDAYHLLGLPAGLNDDVYLAVWRFYAQKYHPDKGTDGKVAIALNQAKEYLK